ncbi:hypothetical protein NM688_g2113 [Phlebia brevispora]|uniref:Uncharacterized protein n=1 Tax=Phlebia brevispora TaxID=194682 RepID=A0ACC1T9D9_9APHY|nr:hypothetical protein NM688_g2113 [Phlebia brevispora]
MTTGASFAMSRRSFPHHPASDFVSSTCLSTQEHSLLYALTYRPEGSIAHYCHKLGDLASNLRQRLVQPNGCGYLDFRTRSRLGLLHPRFSTEYAYQR